MILGIGTDIIEIDRIKKAIINTPKFLEKLFTEKELKQFNLDNPRIESIAGNFAVKEAVSKALGTGMREIGFRDIEVFRDDLGKPFIEVSEKIDKTILVEKYSFHVSISHNKTSAVAFVILEG